MATWSLIEKRVGCMAVARRQDACILEVKRRIITVPIIPTNLGGGEDYRKLPLSMNTQKTPHAPSTASPPEIALGRIETLCSDQVFEGGSQPEESQPTAPTSSGFGEVIRQGFNYLKWSGSAFVSSIAILVGSKMLVEPCLLYTSPSPRDRQKSRMPSSA